MIYVLASVLVSSMLLICGLSFTVAFIFCCVNVNYVFFPRVQIVEDEDLIKEEKERIRDSFDVIL